MYEHLATLLLALVFLVLKFRYRISITFGPSEGNHQRHICRCCRKPLNDPETA
jgi:hypothetical protein